MRVFFHGRGMHDIVDDLRRVVVTLPSINALFATVERTSKTTKS